MNEICTSPLVQRLFPEIERNQIGALVSIRSDEFDTNGVVVTRPSRLALLAAFGVRVTDLSTDARGDLVPAAERGVATPKYRTQTLAFTRSARRRRAHLMIRVAQLNRRAQRLARPDFVRAALEGHVIATICAVQARSRHATFFGIAGVGGVRAGR